MESAVQINNLSKVYNPSNRWQFGSKKDPKIAVDSVSFTVEVGELFGLLGPNGAGKTTLVKMLSTLILPSSGTATVAGFDLKKEQAIRAVTGLVVSDERSFFWRLSIKKNLDFFAAMYGLYGHQAKQRINQVLKDVDLHDRAGQTFSSLSSGMRQRLAIARALLHHPSVLFLDEPTRSLDPIATQKMHDLISRLLREKDMTVFLITHDLLEAEKLCSRVALMHQAKVRQVGRPYELRQHLVPERSYKLICQPMSNHQIDELKKYVSSVNIGNKFTSFGSIEIQFKASENDGKLNHIVDFLRENQVEITSIEGSPPTLEEVFTHYTIETNDK